MTRHFLDLQEAGTLGTPHFKLTHRALRDISHAHAMGAFYGPAGTGKTFAIEAAANTVDVPTYWLEFPLRTTPKTIAHEMLAQVTGVPHEGTRSKLERALRHELEGIEAQFILDESQRLNYECFEYLRYLWDHPKTTFGLAFVGGHGCWELLSRFPMLRSRVARRVEFEPLTAKQALALIPQFHPIYEDADPELIHDIDSNFAQGNLRGWASFTSSAEALMTEVGADELTAEIVANVYTLHRGFIHAP